jgi:hypothetical protein
LAKGLDVDPQILFIAASGRPRSIEAEGGNAIAVFLDFAQKIAMDPSLRKAVTEIVNLWPDEGRAIEACLEKVRRERLRTKKSGCEPGGEE